MSSESPVEPPSRIAWPPLLLVAAVAGGLALDALGLEPASWPQSARAAGIALILLALANDLWCARLMWRSGTTIRPDRAVARLVTEGPFRWSRNPIYVSHVALVAGLGLALASPGMLLLAPLVALGLARLAIAREERHLHRRFGRDYEAYVARTRRWL
jgi:protein-S-isoprenylcysteine O-methyltransferase Ste14